MARQRSTRPRFTYRAYHVGRLRIKAAEILSNGLGYMVSASDIQPATGAYRTDTTQDVYRWEVFTTTGRGLPVVMGCWETLTEFVRIAKDEGFHVDKDREIWSGPKPD